MAALAMKVETFECEEIQDESVEQSEEAKELIEKLGLEGQRNFNVDDSGPRFPYREITMEERAVYRTLCPRETKLKDYSHDPIPLRVLQVAAHAHELFHDLVVWHPESGAVVDPVLVGLRKVGGKDLTYILARWGAELDEWPALCRKAVELYAVRTKAVLAGIVASIEHDGIVCDHLTLEKLTELTRHNWYGKPKEVSYAGLS